MTTNTTSSQSAPQQDQKPEVTQDFNRVFESELEDVYSWRKVTGRASENTPTTEFDRSTLRGIALSGGGVRSSTFCLGVLQSFVESGLFRQFDYLSTVSGGGYIGSAISALQVKATKDQITRPDPPIESNSISTKTETQTISHLRDHSKYLAPTGSGGGLQIAALLLLGITTNIILAIPILIAISFLIMMTLLIGSLSSGTFWLVAVFVLWTAIYAIAVSRPMRQGITSSKQSNWLKLTVALLALFTTLAFLRIHPDAIDFVKNLIAARTEDALRWAQLAAGSLSALGLLLGAIGFLLKRFSGVATKILRLSLGLIAPAFLWLIVLVIVSTLDDPCSWSRFENFSGLEITDPLRNAASPLSSLGIRYYRGDCVYKSESGEIIKTFVHADDLAVVVLIYSTIAIILVGFHFLVNVNSTSLHTFYRDKLAAAYLYSNNDGKRIKLSELSNQTPYHLINAAVNIQNSRQNLRGRDADVFVMSKRFCGSGITGWSPTSAIERADDHIDLAAAMAISGAAVAPNQGQSTNRPLRFLLALVNARLGYWFANPKHIRPGAGIKSRTSPYYFLLELLGLLDETRHRVYLSDGGHIENLGAYELLRRKCRFIFLIDAEHDPTRRFHGLAHLVRIAKIDFNYEIEFSMRDVDADGEKIPRAHCTVGRVKYDNDLYGDILYIKSSVTGDENEYISEYRKRVPAFPHESTTDQFFTEEQFEAYRALGYHIGQEISKGFQGDFQKHFQDLLTRITLDVPDVESYLLVQKRIDEIIRLDQAIVFITDEARKRSAMNSIHNKKILLLEYATIKLKLNEKHIAQGRCRNVVASLASWLHDASIHSHWQANKWRFGAEAHQFVRTHGITS